MLVWVPVFVAIPYLEAPPLSTQFDWTSQFDEQLWSRPSMVKLVLLMNVSDWKPGMFTAPGNGGSGCRFTTTSMILVAPLKVPVERMMTILLVSDVSVSPALLWPVSVGSPAWESLRTDTV